MFQKVINHYIWVEVGEEVTMHVLQSRLQKLSTAAAFHAGLSTPAMPMRCDKIYCCLIRPNGVVFGFA